MKKNYIAPSTVAQTWASMGLMQDANPQIGLATSGSGTKTASDKDFIQ